MKKTILMIAAVAMLVSGCRKSIDKIADEVFEVAKQQAVLMDARLAEDMTPRSLNADGTPIDAGIDWWCSGFYPGTLWYIYEYTGDEQIAELADKHTRRLDSLLNGETGHDIGFQTMCSYGNGYRLTGDEVYHKEMLKNASFLSRRYSPTAGVIRSWGQNFNEDLLVIIDNMMNLELLMEADSARLTDIAYTHALNTIKNHFRDDFTSYHLVIYSIADGSILARHTVQGYADESAWARGQAWAVYGYTMMAREASKKGDSGLAATFLAQAENIAKMLLSRLPEDGIPYWDFDAPDIPDDFRDASAGAVMASAFVELSTLTKDAALAKQLRKAVETQLRTLASPEYLASPGENGNFILKHSVGNKPGNGEVDAPQTYADYYFLEALLRYKNCY